MDEREKELRKHQRADGINRCVRCGKSWPCNEGYLLARLEEAWAELGRRSGWTEDWQEEHDERVRLDAENAALQAQVAQMRGALSLAEQHILSDEHVVGLRTRPWEAQVQRAIQVLEKIRTALSSSPAPQRSPASRDRDDLTSEQIEQMERRRSG